VAPHGEREQGGPRRSVERRQPADSSPEPAGVGDAWPACCTMTWAGEDRRMGAWAVMDQLAWAGLKQIVKFFI
jgi:hypothetical protein